MSIGSCFLFKVLNANTFVRNESLWSERMGVKYFLECDFLYVKYLKLRNKENNNFVVSFIWCASTGFIFSQNAFSIQASLTQRSPLSVHGCVATVDLWVCISGSCCFSHHLTASALRHWYNSLFKNCSQGHSVLVSCHFLLFSRVIKHVPLAMSGVCGMRPVHGVFLLLAWWHLEWAPPTTMTLINNEWHGTEDEWINGCPTFRLMQLILCISLSFTLSNPLCL